MEETSKTMIHGKLIKYLVWLWLGAINIGLDFGLLIRGRYNHGKPFLFLLLIGGIFFAVNATTKIIALFRDEVRSAENQLI